MEENITLKIEILKDNLIKDVSNSGLDISVINYVVQDFARAISVEANRYSQEQIKLYNQKMEVSQLNDEESEMKKEDEENE